MSIKDEPQFAVLMDGTNCFFEISAPDPQLAPARKREFWLQSVVELCKKHGERLYGDPDSSTVWQAMMDARLQEPRMHGDKRLSARLYWRNTNLRLLRTLEAKGYLKSKRLLTGHCAEELHTLHRDLASPNQYRVYPDMEELVTWIADPQGLDAKLVMVTTQRRENILRMFHVSGVSPSIFHDVISSEEVGMHEKHTREFWERVLRRVGVPASHAAVIGSNTATDGYAAECGVAAVGILDRDGSQQNYFRSIKDQATTRGVPFIGVTDSIPTGRFFTYFRDPGDQMFFRLLQMVKNRALQGAR